ncbi:MAG: M48 family metallopeptidase [Candidatus Cloacimonetes bacterium]|nr:M48 family metallopeptidase [Candidatus Cloacimonadota bacterium]
MKYEIKHITYSNFGQVQYKRSNRAKYLRLSIDHAKQIKIVIPAKIPFQKAERFLYSKGNWIIKQRSKIEARNRFTLKHLKEIPQSGKPEARKILLQRLKELAELHDFSFNRSFIRSQKTRWGSCSAKNNINLNIKLINLPEELRDYVIVHELVHTRVKNHQQEFWQEMQKYIKQPRTLDKQLNNYNLKLI